MMMSVFTHTCALHFMIWTMDNEVMRIRLFLVVSRRHGVCMWHSTGVDRQVLSYSLRLRLPTLFRLHAYILIGK